jgi:predicted ATPase/transcriptional regulator with XRE-family HTH domain
MDYEERIPNELLIRMRLEKGWTQSRLAEEVGTTFETVSRWERGVVMPSLFYREKLCGVFGKTAEELGLNKADAASLTSKESDRIVFLSSAYADAERRFVVSLKKELALRDITLWSSGLVKRQPARHKSGILEDAIRAVQLVLIILSPHSRGSVHVRHSRDLARHFKRPVCEVWIEGESLQQCLPDFYSEPGVVIDARQGEESALLNQIATTIERVWLTPGDPGTIELSEPMWNVPESTKALVGREEQLAKVSELLRDPHVRLITLSGPGGIGKTHLALQVAKETREHFVDGTCFISLTTIQDPMLVIPTIAKELGIREVGDSPLFERVKVTLKRKHFLMVLDNFEHVLEASARLPELLASCPHLKIILTSRTRPSGLAANGDKLRFVLIEVDTLSLDAAMKLFQQRARVARGTFEITAANEPVIAEICERLDKLPLAIELAAARIGSFSLQRLLALLKQHPRDVMENVMVDFERSVDDRQRSLHATIGWSYHSLSPGEQQLFRRLAVFAGSCSLEAIEAINYALGGQSLNIWVDVESLLNKSLLRPAEQEGEGRLQMLDTIREYGLERLGENGEDEVAQRVHAEYYLGLTEEAAPHLRGEQQADWLEKLEQEVENVRAALNWMITHKEVELALRFCGALWRFWHLYGYWSEGRRSLKAALGLPTIASPGAARAWALYVAGDLAYYQYDESVASTLLEESVQLSRALGEHRTLALALGTLGVLTPAPDTHAVAHAMLKESEKLCRTMDHSWELAYVLRRRAQHSLYDGNLKQAGDYARECLTLAKKLDDRSLAAYTLGTLGEIAYRLGDIVQAIAYNRESLLFSKELNNKYLLASSLNNLDYFSALLGEPTLASDALEALKLSRVLGDQLLINRVLNTLGYVALRQHNLSQAVIWYREGLSHAVELESKEGTGWNLYGLALVAAAEEQYPQAARLFGTVEVWLDANVDLNPAEHAEYMRTMEHVRNQLGKRVFAAARSEGRSLMPGQILVAPRSAPMVGTPPSPKYPNGLTKREVEVLCLVAEGLTNKAIAQRLHIELRTVTTYLTTAYSKIRVSFDRNEGQVAQRVAAAHFVEDHDLC